jgi:hypothetical protein
MLVLFRISTKREELDATVQHKEEQHRNPGRQVTGCSAVGPLTGLAFKAKLVAG